MLDKLLLFPYWLTLKVRNALYDHQFLVKSQEAEVPTICVGNVTVGGTGKTPHTEMILRMLQAEEGWGQKNLAVLSRGYKRKSKGFQQVTTQRNASFFGDEPVQIKKKFPGVTVALDKNRIRGCRNLCHPEVVRTARQNRRCLDKAFPAADLIILDDAFQYRKLKATLNVVLVDFSRPVNKDKLLPLGDLRDLPERLADADVIIVTKCPYYLDDWERTVWAQSCGVRDYATSTCTLWNSIWCAICCTSPKFSRKTSIGASSAASAIHASRRNCSFVYSGMISAFRQPSLSCVALPSGWVWSASSTCRTVNCAPQTLQTPRVSDVISTSVAPHCGQEIGLISIAIVVLLLICSLLLS